MSKVLGLAGLQGSGKDYTFETLRDLFAPDIVIARAAFADSVRREVAIEVFTALGFDVKAADGAGTWAKPYTAGQRFLLQQYGTEFRRAQDPGYWVDATLQYMNESAAKPDVWVVTDMRFRNEAAAIEEVGGVTATVVADPEVRGRRMGITAEEVAERTKHASEVIDFNTDYTIDNNDRLHIPTALYKWLGSK